jgi:hypothetical protein
MAGTEVGTRTAAEVNERSLGAKWPMMVPALRKLALVAHVTFSVGWLGAVIAFLALAIASVASRDAQMVRGAYLAMGLLVSYVIVPLAVTALLSGLVSAFGTKWGLLRHYWVLVKLLLTIIAVVVLLVQVKPIKGLASVAADPTSSIGGPEARRPLIHAAGGLGVLLMIQILGVYKPRGMTRRGWRQQREQSKVQA